jgi:hypothetical protein
MGFEVDPQTETIRTLYDNHEAPTSTRPWSGKLNSILRHLLVIKGGIVFTDGAELIMAREGQPEPAYLMNELFPKEGGHNVRALDIALSPKGLLLLTDNALYLVPQIHEPEQPMSEPVRQIQPNESFK